MLCKPHEHRIGIIWGRLFAVQPQNFLATVTSKTLTLWLGTRVKPDNRRANDSACAVDQRDGASLTADANARDPNRFFHPIQYVTNRCYRPYPPVLRILFGPSGSGEIGWIAIGIDSKHITVWCCQYGL